MLLGEVERVGRCRAAPALPWELLLCLLEILQDGCLGQAWLHGLLNPLCLIQKCFCPEVKHLVRVALTAVFTEEFTCDKNSCSC